MREMWVRGILFRQVLGYIKKNRSQTSYELLDRNLEEYKIEEKYDFTDFAELLSKIKMIASGENDYIARISRETMLEEASWKGLFRRMAPASVFSSTQRQEGRQQLADYEPEEISNNQVIIHMKMWTDIRDHQDMWAEFYRGRLEGILELMGRKGSVKMVREFGAGGFTYTIRWDQ
jgi:hypothetical protein